MGTHVSLSPYVSRVTTYIQLNPPLPTCTRINAGYVAPFDTPVHRDTLHTCPYSINSQPLSLRIHGDTYALGSQKPTVSAGIRGIMEYMETRVTRDYPETGVPEQARR
jgi:hypothetical protein